MKICQVERPLVATNRIPGLEHRHLQVVKDGSLSMVAVDAVGCKPDFISRRCTLHCIVLHTLTVYQQTSHSVVLVIGDDTPSMKP